MGHGGFVVIEKVKFSRMLIFLIAVAFIYAQDCLLENAPPVALGTVGGCPPGFYCPNGNATIVPQFCPATAECQRKRLLGQPCVSQGTYEPAVCVRGFYCPTYLHQLICPLGFYVTLYILTEFSALKALYVQ
jgi:hypothetical protein